MINREDFDSDEEWNVAVMKLLGETDDILTAEFDEGMKRAAAQLKRWSKQEKIRGIFRHLRKVRQQLANAETLKSAQKHLKRRPCIEAEVCQTWLLQDDDDADL